MPTTEDFLIQVNAVKQLREECEKLEGYISKLECVFEGHCLECGALEGDSHEGDPCSMEGQKYSWEQTRYASK